jgi:hypothetical protein
MGGEAGRGVAKLVAGLLATAALWVQIKTFLKKQNERHKPTRSSLPKNIQKTMVRRRIYHGLKNCVVFVVVFFSTPNLEGTNNVLCHCESQKPTSAIHFPDKINST